MSGCAGPGRRAPAPEALWLLALALLAGAVFELDLARSGDTLIGLLNFDLFQEFLPRHHHAGERLARGELPLWDPHQIAGLPFLAALQGGVLYPPNLLYALLPAAPALDWLARLHLALAGGFAFGLARELGSSRAAAGLAGVAFMLCGSTLFLAYHPNALASAPWLPAALGCALRLGRAGGLRPGLALALVLALQALAGREYTLVMTLHSLGLLALFQAAWALRDGRGARGAAAPLWRLALAGALAGALAAPQLLPTLDLSAASGRTLAGLEPELLEPFGPLPPSLFLANLVVPLRGALRREYLGWIPLLCALVGLGLAWRDRAAGFATALAGLSLLLSFGSQTPLYALYRELPLAATFRLPDRFVFPFSLAMVLLAARGLDALLPGAGAAAPRRSLARCALAPGLFAGTFAALVASGALAAGLAAAARPWGWAFFHGVAPPAPAALGWALAWGAGAALLLGLAAARARRAPARALPAALVALAAAELAFGLESPLLRPGRLPGHAGSAAPCYQQLRALAPAPARHLTLRLPDSHALKDKDGELFGTYAATHYDPLVTRRQAAYFAALEAGGAPLRPGALEDPSPFMGFLRRVPTPERAPLLDLLGVGALLVDGRAALRPPALEALLARFERRAGCRVPAAGGIAPVDLYANPNALPRAFAVSRARRVAGPEEALARLLAPDFDPRREALVEGAPELPGPGPESGSEARVEIARYEPERVELRVRAARPGLAVLTDAFDPDWVARVNGAPARIHPTDALFRGVAFPAGESEIELVYRPRAFRRGAALGAGAAALALALLARAGPRRPPLPWPR